MGLWCWVLFPSIVTTAGEASSKAFPAALVAIVFSKAILGGPVPIVCLGQKHTYLCNWCSMSVSFSYATGGDAIYSPCLPSCCLAAQTLPAPISLWPWCGAQIWGRWMRQSCSVSLSRNESLGGFFKRTFSSHYNEFAAAAALIWS